MKHTFWLTILAAIVLTLGSINVGYAQDTQPNTPSDDEVNAIAKQLFCPVCENIPLDVCPTQACAQWRDLIREKLTQGWSEDQIKTYFVDQYGDRVLATPPARGLNWLVYIIPPIVILAGAFILFRAFQTWRNSAPDQASQDIVIESPADEPAEDYVARLEDELRRR
jgi:cytochrome c-type biogenesis protein CcmH